MENKENIIINDNINLIKKTKSYNLFLYEERLKKKLSRRKFAKELNISSFNFKLIENGYIKPTKKDILKISNYFDINYNNYLEGINSYPTELNNKKFMRITNFMYQAFKNVKVRITFLILSIISLLTLISFSIASYSVSSNNIDKYEPKIQEFYSIFLEKSTASFSILNFKYPEINIVEDIGENTQKATIIKNISYETNYISLHYNQIYWTDNYRFYFTLTEHTSDLTIWQVECLNYSNNESNIIYVFKNEDGFLALDDDGNSNDILDEILNQNDINQDFTNLIKNKLNLDISFDELVQSITKTQEHYSNLEFAFAVVNLFSLIFFLLFLFLFGYSSIYKKDKLEGFDFSHSDELLLNEPKDVKIKKDIKIFPFIPETILKIFGIFLVVIGSIRMIIYTMNVSSYSYQNMNDANSFFSIQLLGMFIIFFINFDIYMDDYRLFRNLMLYPTAYISIYLIEACLMRQLSSTQSVLTIALDKAMFPNPFASATCYFLIIFFLFFTPKHFKTKKQLIIFRLCAIFPIIFLILSFLLGYADILFGIHYSSYWLKYLFRGDRFGLSILAITYLLSLFFLRLKYKIKYGEEKANKMFMGNRYIFIKNAIAALLIIIIWIFEMAFSQDATMNKLGFGLNTYLIILAPLVFLYHPHKCARNTKVDVTLISIYVILLFILYVAAGLMAFVAALS